MKLDLVNSVRSELGDGFVWKVGYESPFFVNSDRNKPVRMICLPAEEWEENLKAMKSNMFRRVAKYTRGGSVDVCSFTAEVSDVVDIVVCRIKFFCSCSMEVFKSIDSSLCVLYLIDALEFVPVEDDVNGSFSILPLQNAQRI